MKDAPVELNRDPAAGARALLEEAFFNHVQLSISKAPDRLLRALFIGVAPGLWI
jgi:hypothetical protein